MQTNEETLTYKRPRRIEYWWYVMEQEAVCRRRRGNAKDLGIAVNGM
jgi:hypothetical protein